MKDKIKILLEEKTNTKTIKDVLFKTWDDGYDLGDKNILSVIGFNPDLSEDTQIIQQYIVEYLSKKIGSDENAKIIDYWLKLVVDTFPKTFLINDQYWYIKFKIDNIGIIKEYFYNVYILDCSVYLSDKSYFMTPEGKKYVVDLEDNFESEHLADEIVLNIEKVLMGYTEKFGLKVSDLVISDIVDDKKMLTEQEDSNEEKIDPLTKFIESINEGDEEEIEAIDTLFSGVENFFRLLIRKHRFFEIDFTSRDLENCNRYNMVLLGLLQLNTPETFKILENIVGFSDIVEENGVYYWWGYREDWSEIFNDSRNGMSKKIINEMLSDSFDSYEYWNSDYRSPLEVYDELTPENAYRVRVVMKEKLLGVTMDIDVDEETPIINKILKLQKSEGNKILLNNFALDLLLNDEDSVKMLFENTSLDDELDEPVKHALSRLLNYAEESVFWDECYEEIFNKIIDSGYADNFKKGVWQQKPNYKGDRWKFDITENLKKVFSEWLNEYKNYSDDIKYYGSYIEMIQHLGNFGYVTAWSPEYADYSKTIKSLNDYYIKDEF